jgi:hypothetical protein
MIIILHLNKGNNKITELRTILQYITRLQQSTHSILRVQSRTWKKEEKIIYWHYLLIHLVEAKLLSCVKFDVL